MPNQAYGSGSVASSAAEGLPALVADAWLRVLRRYFLFAALANLAWEGAHLPLYSLWQEGSVGELAFAAIYCTGGDLLIATASLVLALLLYAERSWSEERFVRVRVAAAAIALGTGHTVFSEWLSTEVCGGSWAYTDPMPVVPFLGTGLSPLAQRLAIPPAAFWWARRSAARNLPRAHPWPTCP